MTLLAAAWAAPTAAADTMQVQPDGKIVVATQTRPEFGALARVDPDGKIDRSFGREGFVIDKRLPNIGAIGLQANGRVVVASIGGLVAGYLPDGSPDPSFGNQGVGGVDDPDTPHIPYGFYTSPGPYAVVSRPDGSFFVASNVGEGQGVDPDAYVRRYGADGELLEQVGHIAKPGPAGWSVLRDLHEVPGGALLGVGNIYAGPQTGEMGLMARFLPGAGSDFDSGFGSGAGLVKSQFGSSKGAFPNATAFGKMALSGGSVFAAGSAQNTLLVAKFDFDGQLDTSFGEGGYSAPQVIGVQPPDHVAHWHAGSEADAIAVAGSGGVTIGGGTNEWGVWHIARDLAPWCTECPQPILARFDASGKLDPSFGNGGLLRLLDPQGRVLEGSVDQLYADGHKTVVFGHARREGAAVEVPFLARLNSDGSYNPSFGDGGFEFVHFPCGSGQDKVLQKEGCAPTPRLRMRIRGLPGRHPSIRLILEPGASWAAIDQAVIKLPPRLRLAGSRSRLGLRTFGPAAKDGVVEVDRAGRGKPQRLIIKDLGRADAIRLNLPRGSVRVTGRRPLPRRIRLTAVLGISHRGWEESWIRTVGRRQS